MPDPTSHRSAVDPPTATARTAAADTLPERRSAARRAAPEQALRSPTLGVRILNLSATGLAIETDRALRVGGRYRFTLATGGEEARLDGKVLWCRLAGTRRLENGDVRAFYRAGIERLP